MEITLDQFFEELAAIKDRFQWNIYGLDAIRGGRLDSIYCPCPIAAWDYVKNKRDWPRSNWLAVSTGVENGLSKEDAESVIDAADNLLAEGPVRARLLQTLGLTERKPKNEQRYSSL